MDESQKHADWKEPDTKNKTNKTPKNIMYNSIYEILVSIN